MIEPYFGYSTPDALIVRGRVLAAPMRKIRDDGGLFANLRNMVALFLTGELADVAVQSGPVTTRTDDEGYFQLQRARDGRTGWLDIPVEIDGDEAAINCPVFVPHNGARFLIISDIDDTVLETGAYSLVRNLWTTFTGNTSSRWVFDDAVRLMDVLSNEGRNPIFYVSSSPWNLHAFLAELFERAGLVRGPMFLRDLGLSETKFITDGHGSHKGTSIDRILSANPGLSAGLVGDTGQKDAEIYAAAKRHPGRIRAIVLRTARPGRTGTPVEKVDFLHDVPVLIGPEFSHHLPRLCAVLGLNGEGAE